MNPDHIFNFMEVVASSTSCESLMSKGVARWEFVHSAMPRPLSPEAWAFAQVVKRTGFSC